MKSKSMFRNVTWFHLDEMPPCLPVGVTVLYPGPLEMSVSSIAEVHELTHNFFVVIETRYRIVPASVVADKVEQRLKAFEHERGSKPGRKMKAIIKDEVVTELMASALIGKKRTNVIINLESKWVAVDTSSRKRAEECLAVIREQIGSLPVRPARPISNFLDALASGRVVSDWCEVSNKVVAYTDGEGKSTHINCADIEIDPSWQTVTKMSVSTLLLDNDEFVLNADARITGLIVPVSEDHEDAAVQFEMCCVIGSIINRLRGEGA